MATAAEKKKAYEEWKERCRQVQAITDTSLLKSETPVERDMRIKRLLNNYAAFCEYYFPHFLQLRDKTTGEVIRTIHNAPFHNEAARKETRPTSRLYSCGRAATPNRPTLMYSRRSG